MLTIEKTGIKETKKIIYITFQTVLDNFDKPWDYEYLCVNPNITWEIVRENLFIPWSYFYLLTWEIIREHNIVNLNLILLTTLICGVIIHYLKIQT